MLEIKVETRAGKFLKKILYKHAQQIVRKIDALAINPFPPDSKQLKGSIYRGTDIGEYRIIYKIEEQTLRVYLIGKRNDDEVYRKLKRME